MGCKGGAPRNAWSRPWSWSQAASHIATVYAICCFAVLVQPGWQGAGKILLLVLFWVVFVISLGLYLFVCMADTRYREDSHPPSCDFESRRCEDCLESINNFRVKHCQTCGKCTADFDHHCHYLNVCIGGRTYTAWFFFVAGLLSIMAACGYGAMDGIMTPERFPMASRFRTAFRVLLWIEAIVSLVLAAFLLCLLAQHVFFIYEGITTLEYVKDQPPRFPSLPPRGWREAVQLGECYNCREFLELCEAEDSGEVWFCTVCQSEVGKAGVKFYSCESCDCVNVCPICFRAAKLQDMPIVTYRVTSLRKRVDSQAFMTGLHGQSTSRISSHSSQREGRKKRRTLTSIVANFEGHSGDAKAEDEDGDDSGTSSDESEGL